MSELIEHLSRCASATYTTLGEVVVKSEHVFAVVEALDVVTRGRVVGAPENHKLTSINMIIPKLYSVNSPVHVVHDM